MLISVWMFLSAILLAVVVCTARAGIIDLVPVVVVVGWLIMCTVVVVGYCLQQTIKTVDKVEYKILLRLCEELQNCVTDELAACDKREIAESPILSEHRQVSMKADKIIKRAKG